MLVQHGSYIKAVNYSTFATFIGALASYIYLIAYSRKRMGHYRELYHESVPVHDMHVFTIFKNIFKEALPFIFVGSAITIYQFIDQLTFKDIMVELTGLDALQAQDLYTYFSANPSKITTVVISLTIAISESSLPLLATLAKQNDKRQIGKTIAQNVELMLLTLLPSSLLLAVLSWEVNGVFFPFSRLGANLLAYALVTSIALALFTDFFTIVQSLGKHRLAVRYLTLGIILKLALQVPLTYLFGAYGALSATTVSFLLISLGVYGQIKKHYLVRGQMKNVKLIIVINLLVALMAYLTNKLISLVYLPQNKLTAFLYAAVFGGAFVLLYIALLNKSGIFKEVFGFKVKLAVKGKH
jgi:O-antigen/teichoic acid export membrane protein